MPLQNYGLLTGKLIGHGDQHGGNPHYLLTVDASGVHFRVAVNLKSTLNERATNQLQYQIIPNLTKANARARELVRAVPNGDRFVVADGGAIPRLDFVRDRILDMTKFVDVPETNNRYYSAFVAAAAKVQGNPDAYVAVFGAGYGAGGSGDPRQSSGGFAGVDSVHMNQGSYKTIGHLSDQHFKENGPNQDGAVLFFFSDGTVQGFFSKFQSQDIETDEHGNPIHTNVAKLDATPSEVAKVITAGVARRKKKAAKMLVALRAKHPGPSFKAAAKRPGGKPPVAPATPAVPASGFVFSDPVSAPPPNAPFVPDDDSNVDQNFVDQFAQHGVPEPVPGPRDGMYPTMTLESVVGTATVKAIQKAGKIVFHAVGDTGAATQVKLPHETSVAAMMLKDFSGNQNDQPAFFYHLGDVVYYFGEQAYYYSQFYDPYRKYPRPIFAIPGNHDGITYSTAMTSLGPFRQAFVDSAPSHWEGSGGISRTSMTQPGVFFTLDAPFVSIIGLYSNCSESYGFLDDQQTLFLFNDLVRLKLKRASGEIAAVILAVHHPPMSFSAAKPSSMALRNDIDTACQKAGIWPDAILSGHAHLYQRMTRTVTLGNQSLDVPHVICGAGGINITVTQEVDRADMKVLDSSDPNFRLHQFLAHFGYLRLTVTPKAGSQNGTLRIEFLSPNIQAAGAADTCVLDLETRTLV
jgi:uncharacterized protein YukJ